MEKKESDEVLRPDGAQPYIHQPTVREVFRVLIALITASSFHPMRHRLPGNREAFFQNVRGRGGVPFTSPTCCSRRQTNTS